MNAAIWSRVSTQEQDTTNQLDQLRQWAGRLGHTVVKEYTLEGESAYKGKHLPMLNKALQDAHERIYDVLLVWALDRVSRQGVEETLRIMRKFRERGVTVLSLQEPWAGATGEAGELLMSVMAWVANMESQRRSERTKAGLERVRKQGRTLGRPVGAKDGKRRKRAGYFARWATT